MTTFLFRNTQTGARTEIAGGQSLEATSLLGTGSYRVRAASPEAPMPLQITGNGSGPAFDPEAALAGPAARALPGTGGIGALGTAPGGSHVLVFDFADRGPGGGAIFRQAGPLQGLYIGFRENGDLISRCGSSLDEGAPAAAVVRIGAADLPLRGQVAVEFSQLGDGRVRVRVWINGIWIASVASLAAGFALFSEAEGAYLTRGGTGVPQISSGIYEANGRAAGNFGDLRLYANAQVTSEPGSWPRQGAVGQVRDLRLLPASDALGIYWNPPAAEADGTARGYVVEINGAVQPETALTSFYLPAAAAGAYRVRVRSVSQTGVAGGWSEAAVAEVSADLPASMVPVLADTVTFNGVTLTLDRAMPIARSVDGRPIILSGGQSFRVVDDAPAAGFQETGPGNEGIGNGMMRDPSFFRLGAVQGFDEMMAAGNDSTTRVDYLDELNVAPSHAGPLLIPQGAATSLVKSLRRDQVSAPWADRPTRNWPIGGYAIFSVMPHPLPQDAYRPAVSPLDKIANLKFARAYDDSVLRSLTPPAAYPIDFEAVLAETATDLAFFGDRGERQNTYGPDDDYSAQWMERRKHVFRALHSTLPPAQKRRLADLVITHAIDLEAIIDAGWRGESGAGQGLGFIGYLYFAGFLLQDAALLEKARATRSSEFGGPHYFTPRHRIGQAVPFPSSRGRGGKFDQTWFEAHLGTVMIQTSGDGSLVTSRYSEIVQRAAPKGALPVVLLRNGPQGETGIAAITGAGDLVGPANPASAPVASMDVFRHVSADGDQAAFHDAWRREAGVPYEEQPKQLAQGSRYADRFQAISRGVAWDWTGWDFVSGTYDSAVFRYSLDQRSWTEVPGQGRQGSLTGLMVGVPYHVGLALRDTQGRQGVFSPNFADSLDAPVRGTVVPFGASPRAAPLNTRAPVLTYRPYPDWAGPHFAPIAPGETIPRDALALYPSVGDWTGFPVPAFTWRIRRNGVDLTPDLPFDAESVYLRTLQDYSSADRDTYLDIVVTADNGTDPAVEATSAPVYLPRRAARPAGVLIDSAFTPAFSLDRKEVWDGIAGLEGDLHLSPTYFNAASATAGYLMLRKTGPRPRLRVPLGPVVGGARYRVEAELILDGTGSVTEVTIRGDGLRIDLDEIPPVRDLDNPVQRRSYSFQVPPAQDGAALFLELFLASPSGGSGGGDIGLGSLRVERF